MVRHPVAFLSIAVVCTMTVSPVAPAQIPPADATLEAAVRSAMSLRAASIVRLAIDKEPAQLIRITVPLEGMSCTVDLTPHSVRAPGYRLIEARADGSLVDRKPGPDTTYRGGVQGVADSVAAGGIVDGGLYATVSLGDGRRYWIEPVPRHLAGEAPGAHVVYAAADIIPTGARCLTDDPPAPSEPGTPMGPRGSTLYRAQIACDADYEYYVRYGNIAAVQARISAVINTMNLQYERDVDITHDVTAIVVRSAEPDPFTTVSGLPLLNEFRAWWNSYFPDIQHDVALLFTGKNVDNCFCAAGKAYTGTVCTPDGYGWIQADLGFSFAFACDDAAHEIGHTWNACHCACTSPAYTMDPNITSVNRFGGPPSECATGWNSTTEIFVFRGTRTCLDTSYSGGIVRNDWACSAVPIGPGSWGFNTYNTNTDGPPASCRPGTRDIWYKYIAPCSGTATVTTCNSNYDTVLIAYWGGWCTDIASREIACNDDDAGACPGQSGLLSRISFGVSGGAEYLIRVAGYADATGAGLLNLTHSSSCGPPNDFCGSPMIIGRERNYSFSTTGATTDGFLEGLCNNAGDSHVLNDVWFRYDIPAGCGNQVVRISLCGSTFDTKLAVYWINCPTNANQAIACNDDNGPACGGLQSSVDVVPPFGGTYLIRVGGYNGATGSGTIRIDHGNCPVWSNDNCRDAIPVGLGSPVGFAYTTGATHDGTASCSPSTYSVDVWFSYTSPCTQTIHADLCGSNYDTALSVHRGCPGEFINYEVACNDDTAQCINGSALDFTANAGWTYHIRVSGAGGANGLYRLNLASVGVPNNDCSGAQAVSDGATTFCNAGATDGWPTCASIKDVWYRYVAGCTGRVRVGACLPTGSVAVAAYTEAACPYPIGLYQLACGATVGCAGAQTGSTVEFNVTAGTAYLIRIGGDGGTGTLTITRLRPADCDGNGLYQPADVACFINTWFASLQQGTPAGDFDGNGLVNPADVAAFINAWFAGLNGGC